MTIYNVGRTVVALVRADSPDQAREKLDSHIEKDRFMGVHEDPGDSTQWVFESETLPPDIERDGVLN